MDVRPRLFTHVPGPDRARSRARGVPRSFACVCMVWVNHHWFFQRVRAVDSAMLWWNLAILLAASIRAVPHRDARRNLDGTRADGVTAVAAEAFRGGRAFAGHERRPR